MSFKHFLAAALVSTSALAAAEPDFVVPAVASTDGALGSRWTSELTLHNAGTSPMQLKLSYHTGSLILDEHVTLPGRSTLSYADVVAENFNSTGSAGALEIDVEVGEPRKLAIASRAVNTLAGGELGQDVPAMRIADLMLQGDTAVIAGPRRASGYRFNAGVYAMDATSVTWSLLRRDGTIAATKDVQYLAGRQLQHNAVVSTLLEGSSEAGDVLHAKVNSGRAFFYGSIVADSTNDPTFVHAMRTRQNFVATVAGIDHDENGTVDVADANLDYRIDAPIVVTTIGYPSYFRLVATDPEGEPLTYELIGAMSGVAVTNDGSIKWVASQILRGTSSTLTVRVSDGTDSVDVVIPINFL